MPKIKLYHIKLLTLLWTYLVWTGPNLLFAFWFCDIEKLPLIWMLYYWGLLHILPLMLFLGVEGFGVLFPVCALLSAVLLVAGLLIKRWWALFWIMMGISIWFGEALCIFALTGALCRGGH